MKRDFVETELARLDLAIDAWMQAIKNPERSELPGLRRDLLVIARRLIFICDEGDIRDIPTRVSLAVLWLRIIECLGATLTEAELQSVIPEAEKAAALAERGDPLEALEDIHNVLADIVGLHAEARDQVEDLLRSPEGETSDGKDSE